RGISAAVDAYHYLIQRFGLSQQRRQGGGCSGLLVEHGRYDGHRVRAAHRHCPIRQEAQGSVKEYGWRCQHAQERRQRVLSRLAEAVKARRAGKDYHRRAVSRSLQSLAQRRRPAVPPWHRKLYRKLYRKLCRELRVPRGLSLLM